MNRIRLFFFTVIIIVCILILGSISFSGQNTDSGWISLPYSGSQGITGKYVYVVGGYNTLDDGGPGWGTADASKSRVIGDKMGELEIKFEDGTSANIPLVFGYTMWFYEGWKEAEFPFKSDKADPQLRSLLTSSLHLLGAYEGSDTCVFRVNTEGRKVIGLKIKDNPDEDGEPIFKGAFITDESAGVLQTGEYSFSASDSFFDTHTISINDTYPISVQDNISKINKALMTYYEAFDNVDTFRYPDEYTGSKILFTGNSLANIATGVVYHNLDNLQKRVDDDGFLHTSYKDAVTWRYAGFGYWLNAGSYYDFFYSRDGGRAIMTMNTFGQNDEAARSILFGNKCMMYFPDNNMTFMGVKIPGHYTVMVNKPMHYSTYLVPEAWWPTRYTEAKFGADYQNLGNQETDGHGLMMMANYSVWRNLGSTEKWVNDNWTHINEGVAWIQWCFEHTDLSFAKNGILYAESEAGMNDYTMYCNVPCYLGVLGYSQMAQAAGKTEISNEWYALANQMKEDIYKQFRNQKTGSWKADRYGFYHDPVITMMSDMFGYDLADMDPAWVDISRSSYAEDIASVADNGYFGPTGTGYDHSMITQSALLLDNMSDATKLIENLTRVSYAPGFIEPYLVPEGFTVNTAEGYIRRQGDLGNLVQLAEAMKCYAITVGISQVNNNTLKIMPRLPEGWQVDVQNFDLQNATGAIDLLVSYPQSGIQTVRLTLGDTEGFDTVRMRLGPLPAGTGLCAVQVNGVNTPCEMVSSGDSSWAWVTLDTDSAEKKIALIYGDSIENLPSWPDKWPEHNISENVSRTPADNKSPVMLIIIISATACVVLIAIVTTVIIKKKRR